MQIKDLPQDEGLRGQAFIHPKTGERVYWHSQWQAGVWFKRDMASAQVFPLHVNQLIDSLEFEVPE